MEVSYNATNSGTVDFFNERRIFGLANLRACLMKNPKFREEFYKPDDIGCELKFVRRMKGITQQELADKIGTTQPNIARVEKWGRWTGLRLIHKMARALGCYLEIKIKEEIKPKGEL